MAPRHSARRLSPKRIAHPETSKLATKPSRSPNRNVARMNNQNIEKKNISFVESGPVSVILSSDEGAAGKTTTALQLVTAFALA